VLARPEAVTAVATPDGPALVQVATFLGAVTRITFSLGDGTEVKADLPSHEAGAFPIGSRAAVTLAERPVLVVPRI
jgi:putative spermidine/putrescine transport system ATP-binding protein